MRKYVERLIIKNKRKSFSFDSSVSLGNIINLVVDRLVMRLRGRMKLRFIVSKNSPYLGRNVRVSGKCAFGSTITIGSFTRISGLAIEGVSLGNKVNIGAFSSIIASTTYNFLGRGIQISDNVAIGEYAYLGGAGGLTIGTNTIVGQYFSCHPENHRFSDKTKLIRLQGVTREGIHIGSNCWIGSKVTFLDGSKVGDNCVIAAGAVVTKKFGDSLMIGGVPAKILKVL
jgi:acetyltransferase-like isoleucine patch superfamily enzyme